MTSEGPDVLLVASDGKYEELRSRWFRRVDVGLPRATPEAASHRYKFDLGHPVDGTAYVRHPCVTNYYLVPAQANERMAAEKLAAFTHIAAALGARRLELLSVDISEVSRQAGLKLPVLAKQLGFAGSVNREGTFSRHVYSEFGEPDRPPYVPAQHRAWLDMDPVLRSLVDTRLAAHPNTWQVALEFTDMLERVASLEAQVAKLGVSVGGKCRSVGRSTWRFNVEFWPAAHATSPEEARTSLYSSPSVDDGAPSPPGSEDTGRMARARRRRRRLAAAPVLGGGVFIAAIVVLAITQPWESSRSRTAAPPAVRDTKASASAATPARHDVPTSASYADHMKKGRQLWDQRKWRDTLVEFEAALAAKPGDFAAMGEVVWTADHVGEFARARDVGVLAVEAAPLGDPRAMALFNLALVEEELDAHAALLLCSESLRLRPNATVQGEFDKLKAAGAREAATEAGDALLDRLHIRH